MPKTRRWYQKLTAWAGWLLAAGLLVLLAVGALSLSPDGARLRRLAGLSGDRARSREVQPLGGTTRASVAAYEGVATGADAGADARRPQAEGQSSAPGITPVGPEGPSSALSHGGGESAEAHGMGPRRGIFEASSSRAEEGLATLENTPDSQPRAIPGLEGPWKNEAMPEAKTLQQTEPPANASTEPFLSSTGSIKAEVMGQSEAAQVLLDGERRGVTPVLLTNVEAGVHRMTFVHGDQLWEEEVRVSAGDTTLVACSLLNQMAPGRVIVQSPRGLRGNDAGADSVLVNGGYRGQGEVELELPPGYHTVTFTRPGAGRRHVVIDVQPGSVQYVSPPGPGASLAMRHSPPERDGKGLAFRLRIDPVPKSPPKVALCFVPHGTASLKVAQMSWQPADGVFTAAIDVKSLPAAHGAQYFFRATLVSGEEIDSEIYSVRR